MYISKCFGRKIEPLLYKCLSSFTLSFFGDIQQYTSKSQTTIPEYYTSPSLWLKKKKKKRIPTNSCIFKYIRQWQKTIPDEAFTNTSTPQISAILAGSAGSSCETKLLANTHLFHIAQA